MSTLHRHRAPVSMASSKVQQLLDEDLALKEQIEQLKDALRQQSVTQTSRQPQAEGASDVNSGAAMPRVSLGPQRLDPRSLRYAPPSTADMLFEHARLETLRVFQSLREEIRSMDE